jgi:hypothetical protein
MAHVRTDVRVALKAVLDAAKPAGWTIEISRDRKPDVSQMPRLIIGASRETAIRGSSGQPVARTIMYELTAYLTTAADVDGALDAAAVWIEAPLEADPKLGGVASDTIYRGTDITVHSGGEQPVGEMTLTYEIRAQKALSSF